ncbi:MAG: DUF3347 domain-containing protein [Ferruginibacter sp.]|nr:DUF3347 domain-containing protein [Ferruginibacter sp.]
MKKMLFTLTVLLATAGSFLTAQDSKNDPPGSPLLAHYYQVSEALVAGNAAAAATHANAFIKVANATDYKKISEGNITTLVKDASAIAGTKDLTKQREYFMNFSRNMLAVAKAVKLSDKPVYEVYCPMKKASWLSAAKDIRNPYYGSSMLTCGEVKSTIE